MSSIYQNQNETKAVMVPTKPVIPMSTLENKSEIPEINARLAEKLKKLEKLFSEPDQLNNKEHCNDGMDRACAPTHFAYHA
jgi:hypothetical protein